MRRAKRLSVRFATTVSDPGLYADGGGLWLQITRSKTGDGYCRSWIFRWTRNGRMRSMGLGPLYTVGLAEAREIAAECRLLVHRGQDPIEKRRLERSQAIATAAQTRTFEQVAKEYLKEHEPRWGEQHYHDVETALENYVYPTLGALEVQTINTSLVLSAIRPLWNQKNRTAHRLQGRIENILDFAISHQYRTGPNPARWRDHLKHLLVVPTKKQNANHLAAMDFHDIPEFMAKLRTPRMSTARVEAALEFLILTAARSSEVRKAVWSEFDFDARLWTIPRHRMKARVELGDRALEILRAQPRRSELVFNGKKLGVAITAASLQGGLTRLEIPSTVAVPHGFRSSFRDWAAEMTYHENHVVEKALAHSIPSAVEAAYRRGDLLQKRRLLMIDWEKYCCTPQSAADIKVVRLKMTG